MPKLREDDIEARLQNLNGWELNGKSILKEFEFDSFVEALDFVNDVGELSEDHGHHPHIQIDFDTVNLELTTHSEKGLTEKDFALAEEIDNI